MNWRVGLRGAILPVLAAAQLVTLATDARVGLADNQQDCSFQGPVRSIEIARSAIEDGRESKPEPSAKCIFDRNGRESEYWQYYDQGGDNGKGTARWIFSYDSHGRPIESALFDSKEDRTSPRRFVTKYDSSGREWETHSIDPDGTVDFRTIKEYDGRGDAVKETSYDFTGKIDGVTIRLYDVAHHVIREENYRMNPKAESTKIFRYNNAGQRTEEIFDWEDSPARYLYTYDNHGHRNEDESAASRVRRPIGANLVIDVS